MRERGGIDSSVLLARCLPGEAPLSAPRLLLTRRPTFRRRQASSRVPSAPRFRSVGTLLALEHTRLPRATALRVQILYLRVSREIPM